MDEPHPAYNFFAPGQLPGYTGNPNNNNGCIEADVPLLGDLGEKGEPQGAEVDEPMVVPAIKEVVKPMVEEVNEDWLMAPVTPPPMPVVPPPSVYEVRGPSTIVDEGPSFPFPAPGLPVSDAEVEHNITIGEIGPRVSA
ncbi:hypothetical protein Tco_1035285, partial [Tanacetum coccineum]